MKMNIFGSHFGSFRLMFNLTNGAWEIFPNVGSKILHFGTWSNRLEMFQFRKLTRLESEHFFDPFRPFSTPYLQK